MREKNELQFYGLGIAPKILDRLARLQFKNATVIQHKTIPLALEGQDVIGIAQTGTGKTLAFVIPTVQRILKTRKKALVLAPTRELALQVKDSFQKIAPMMGVKSVALIGGESIHRQIALLARGPQVYIATPGRLLDLVQRQAVQLKDIGILVLDEVDQMLDMGFAPQINQILGFVPKERQTLIFSATLPPPIMRLACQHMNVPVSVEVDPAGTAAENVTHELFIVRREMKSALLGKIVEKFSGSILVFCRTKIGTAKVARILRRQGHSAGEIHSDRTQGQRKEALQKFKEGRIRILVATDIAARGLDVKGVELVINYDLPETAESYVHRIGRTGRAGCQGHAIAMATPDQKRDVLNIEQFLKRALPRSSHPEVPAVEFDKPQKIFSASRYRRVGRRPVSSRRRTSGQR